MYCGNATYSHCLTVLCSITPQERHSACSQQVSESYVGAVTGQWGSTFHAVLLLELVEGLALREAAAGLPAVSGVEGPP